LFEDLKLDGVLYVGGMPRAAFKRVEEPSAVQVRNWHRVVWNHAVTPLLVLFSDTRVWVYSGQALPARPGQNLEEDGRLVEDLQSVADILQFDNMVTSIESGEVFRKQPGSFDREKGVDRYLLKNIEAAADCLSGCKTDGGPLTSQEARQLLLRVLFACYLIDRDMLSGRHFAAGDALHGLSRRHGLRAVLEGLAPAERVGALVRLFERIGSLFNGSAFTPEDLKKQKNLLSEKHLDVLMGFLRGDDLGLGQLALGFWAYDFRHIPIETISAIYESFLEADQSEKKEETGAYYTPPHLAELVVDVLLEDLPKPLLQCRALDPACGSGVFLVALFNRMAEQWRRANPCPGNIIRARELQRILKEQLFGMDRNPMACQIACFSLYLAYLDQLSPRDVEELREKGVRLPKLLLGEDEKQAIDETRTIINRNFFAGDRQLPTDGFDLIVGNPPWVSRGKVRDTAFLEWAKRAERESRPVPQKQTAYGFLWESIPMLNETGRACLLVPASVLLGQNSDFHDAWFRAASVDKIVDFSDLRRLLFPGAKHPCIALRFAAALPTDGAGILYEVPKTDVASQLGGPVVIYDGDVERVPLAEVLYEAKEERAPLVWKTRLWGTPRDRRFLQRLSDMPRLADLVGRPRDRKRWIGGQGFQPYSENDESKGKKKHVARWPEEALFLDARSPALHYVVVQEDCTRVGAEYNVLRYHRDKRVFENPKVLVSQGSKTLKAAFCDFPVLFTHSLQSIAGPGNDAPLLHFLAAILHSRIGEYYLFHTSASLGTERDKTHFFELLRLPFPLPEQCEHPAKARRIVAKASNQIQRLSRRIRAGELKIGRHEEIDALERRLDPLVLEYYEVDEAEQMLIDDTLKVFKPSATPPSPITRVPTLRPPQDAERVQYVDTLCWALRGQTVPGFRGHIVGQITPDPRAGLGLVTLSQGHRPQDTTESNGSEPLSRTLSRLAEALPSHRRSFAYVRNVKIIGKGQIHVVKPLMLRFWTRTAALNDADEILGAVLMRGRSR